MSLLYFSVLGWTQYALLVPVIAACHVMLIQCGGYNELSNFISVHCCCGKDFHIVTAYIIHFYVQLFSLLISHMC